MLMIVNQYCNNNIVSKGGVVHDIKIDGKSKDELYKLKLQYQLDKLMYLIELSQELRQPKPING